MEMQFYQDSLRKYMQTLFKNWKPGSLVKSRMPSEQKTQNMSSSDNKKQKQNKTKTKQNIMPLPHRPSGNLTDSMHYAAHGWL